MFIVSQDNTKMYELNNIELHSSYTDDVLKELENIYDSMIVKAYNYGSTENCKNAISEEQESYLRYKNKMYEIHVNGVKFASYKSEGMRDREFYNIKNAILLKEELYQLEKE